MDYRGQMSAVARKLGIGRSTLYRKLKEYDLQHGDTELSAGKTNDETESDAA